MQLSLPLSVSQPFASTIDEMFAIWQTVHRILQPSSNLSNLKARGCQNWQGRIIKGQIRSWQVRKGKVVFQQKGSLTKRPTRRCHAAKKAATKDVAKSAKRMGLDLR